MTEERIQMNINVTAEDARMIDRMMTEDAYDNRSAFVRRLVRQEWARRYSQPNPAVTVKQAERASKAVAVK